MSKLEAAEELLVDYAGPMGKFVLKNKMREMGLSEGTMSDEKIWELLKAAIPDAIFDPEMQRKALHQLRENLSLSISL